MPKPIIPENITVHLGYPSSSGENITIPFIDYIKNVASSEIFPTWPENAIRANILAQISFALNRIYTEWYPSQGRDFDITSVTAYDQKFIKDRDIFANISEIVDEVFNDYVVRQGSIEPLFTSYCDGRQVQCDGLSQWGTVELANQGMSPYEILQYYYGDDINIVFNAPVGNNIPSYPGNTIQLGSIGEDVRTIQNQLNRVAVNYPAIPVIPNTDGVFNVQTEAAVRKFQDVFNLTSDGIIGKSTWYKIKYIYNSVKELSELSSEGLSYDEVSRIYKTTLQMGDKGPEVNAIQYYLAVIAYFDPEISPLDITGVFDQATHDSVVSFQKKYGLIADGIIGRETWNKIINQYDFLVDTIPPAYLSTSNELYPGRFLTFGVRGQDVTDLQNLLVLAAEKHSFIPTVKVTGIYDDATRHAVKVIQEEYDMPVNGITGPMTWYRILTLSKS